jgi:hypothetical protein
MLVRMYIKAVCLKSAAFKALECFASVVKALTCLGKTDATDASWTTRIRLPGRLSRLILDVLDAWGEHGVILTLF